MPIDADIETIPADCRVFRDTDGDGAQLFARTGEPSISAFSQQRKPPTPPMRRRRASCSANLPGRSSRRERPNAGLHRSRTLGILWLAGYSNIIPQDSNKSN